MHVRLSGFAIGLGLFVGGCTPVGPPSDIERGAPAEAGLAATTPAEPAEPEPEPLAGIVQVVASGNATCALDKEGAVFCWGIFTGGTYEDASVPLFGFRARRPVRVEGPKATRIAAYPRGVGMLDVEGALFVSGQFERAGRERRSFEPLGESVGGKNIQRLFSARSRATPLCWVGADEVLHCRSGERHEIPKGALVDERAPGCFAHGNAVQCHHESPSLLAALDGDCGQDPRGLEGKRRSDFDVHPAQLYGSAQSVCALDERGVLECLHYESMGGVCEHRRTIGMCTDRYVQQRKTWPGPFVDVSVSGDNRKFGFAAHANGTVLSLDRGAAVLGPTEIVQLTASVGHTCALSRDGHVWCWGDNGDGQLGNGTQQDGSPAAASLVLAPKDSHSMSRSSGSRGPAPIRSHRQPDVGAPPRLCPVMSR